MLTSRRKSGQGGSSAMETNGLGPEPPDKERDDNESKSDQRLSLLGTPVVSDILRSTEQIVVDKVETNSTVVRGSILAGAGQKPGSSSLKALPGSSTSHTGNINIENINQTNNKAGNKCELTNVDRAVGKNKEQAVGKNTSRSISNTAPCPQPLVHSEPLITGQANPSIQQENGKDPEIDKVLARGRRPFEVVLKGGTPWGFALNGGKGTTTPLHISKIVPGGKASDSALVEKDYVLRINDVPCSDVGQALDIVDTAFTTLTITVLRGNWDFPSNGLRQQSHQQRATDLRRKEYRGQRHSDDSIVYTQSKSSQAATMRPSRRRGESFNVGKLSGVPPDKGVPPKNHSPSSDPPWGPRGDQRRSAPNDATGGEGRYHETHWSAVGQGQKQRDHLANVNRRRSDGQTLSSSPSSSSSSAYQQHQQRQLLLSMKSSPNLAKPDGGNIDESVLASPRGQPHMMSTKSSPNILDDLGIESRHQEASDLRYASQGMLRTSSSDHNMKQGIYANSNVPSPREYGSQVYSPDMYTSEMNASKKQMRRSMPAHSLYRYQPDYENVSLLGTAPLRSEKISEIDDIDEVTGRESVPQSPDTQSYNPMGGAGLPTRDPASLKYIKVNQNHEKYPSWPVTKPSGASEQTQPINTRAQSMTDNTNTSKEFPQKQRLAYTPGLRPLAEKNSPVAERKAEDGKGRNTSDPGLNSEFVYDRFGRVHRRNYDSVENKFEDFYKNSKSGYPPPKMDPDGNNIGDKNYNAPSPPERESKGVDQQELSTRLSGIEDQSSYHQQRANYGEHSSRFSNTQQYPPYPATSQDPNKTGGNVRPSNLNIKHENLPAEQGSSRTDSSTSPLEGSPLSYNQREIRSNSQGDNSQPASLQSRPRSWHDPYKQASPLQPWQDRNESVRQQSPSTALTASQSPAPQAALRPRQSPKTDPSIRPSSSGEFSIQSNIHQDRSSSEKSKSYIVKSTPYYNTSTQTEMMPYAIKFSNPSIQSSKLRNVETQVGEFGTQTSPKTPEDQKKMYEEKSIQARMSRDFQNTDLETNFEKKFPTDLKLHGEEFFKFPPSNSMRSSQFTGIHDIQAKYATDEIPNTNSGNNHSKNSIPSFMDNSGASILRKLSEEFYGNRLGLTGDKRLSSASSQEPSPKYDAATAGTALQPGLREAESYSSVVIHHDQTAGLFGRDDFGSVSSIADSRHDVSSVFSEASSSYKTDSSSRSRRSLDPALLSQKSRFQQNDPRTFSSTSSSGHHRETSAPVISSSNLSRGNINQSSPTGSAKPYNMLNSSNNNHDLSSTTARPTSSSDPRHPQGTTFTNNVESLSGPGSQVPIAKPSSITTSAVQARKQPGLEEPRINRHGSDSVFISTEDDLSDYQFNRKPSLRKAYGIYDETERLISQSSATQSKPLGKEQDGLTSAYVPMSRNNKSSDSLGLGLIQEEDDPSTGESSSGQRPSGNSSGAFDERPGAGREEQVRYPWQTEAWRKSQVELLKGCNLKRTTSEQIPVLKPSTSYKPSSYDTETGLLRNNEKPVPTFPGPSPHSMDYQSLHNHTSSDYGSSHSRTQSEDLTLLSNEPDLKKFQQQAVLSFYQRKTHGSSSSQGSSQLKEAFSTDSSMYESIEGSHSESVADIISKANENLAKSAQRVDSIRRSNSTSSRSSDYMDMAKHDRMRRETDWSRLRSSGSLRYSPDNDRRSNRSSFASENHYEDISMFSPSTPRDSIADSMDINLDTGNVNASMDSGLVASPTYQNFPNRRPPPPVPRSPSPEAPPPALPPRNYREPDGGSNTGNLQDTSRPPLSPNDKHRISTTPLGKQLEDPQVENTKRDFKSLMNQWENSSPREDKYAAELRKQAQKLTGQQQQQQQHPNATPMALLHSRTKISYATTYKREPMLPQEATSPSASTSSLASSHTSSSTSPTSSSSHFQTSSGTSTSTRQQPQPQNLHTTSNDQQPAPTNNAGNGPYISNIKVSYGQAPTSAPQIPDRSFPLEDVRNRSSSELVSNNLPCMGPGTLGKSGRPSDHLLRDRSASDHDILSDRRHQPQETHFGASPEGAPLAITKWRHASGSSVVSSTAPSGSGVDTNFAHEASAEDGFAEESYIGHKNKSSRAIGTYQRSKSAAVLQGNHHTLEDEDQKLGQQNWNSESVLTQGQTAGAEPAQASTVNNSHNDKAEVIPEFSTAASAPPVRPARPSTYGRHGNAGGAAPPSASTAQSSSVSTASTATAPPQGPSSSVFSAKPFTVEQPGWIARRDSPRRNPDSSDSNPSPMRGQGQPGSNSDHPSYRWPGDDNPRAPPAVIQSQYSPQRRVPPSDSSPSPQWSANGMNSYKQAPISSSPDNAYNRPGELLSPSEELPVALPPRDYIRRDSAPVKSAPSAVSPDNKLSVNADASRRRSDSSVNSTTRPDNGDVSSSVHSRQPSQEELECDEKAKQLAQELSDKDQKLSEVLRLDSTKKRMQYMDGLFSGAMEGNSSQEKLAFNSESRSSVKLGSPQHQKQKENPQKEIPEIKKRGSLPKEYWMSPSKAMLEMELRRNEEVGKDITKDIIDSSTLMKQKEELMDKLHKKLEILKEAKLLLQKEIVENEELGKQVHHLVDTNGWLTQNEKDKFKTYIDDLEKIVRLLLNLSGQLARAENAVQALPPDADAKLRKMTVDKRERLSAKHEEAKLLKDDIDKRSEQLSQILQDRLNKAEFSDYTHYIKMKSKLTIDLQELDDKITLGGEQIVELKKSIPDHNDA